MFGGQLASALEEYLWKNNPSLERISISWPTPFFEKNLVPTFDHRKLLNFATGKTADARINWLGLENTVLITDEAQRSYEHEGLWGDFLRFQAAGRTEGILVILFSSYGSPAETPLKIDGSAPIHFSLEQ